MLRKTHCNACSVAAVVRAGAQVAGFVSLRKAAGNSFISQRKVSVAPERVGVNPTLYRSILVNMANTTTGKRTPQ